MTTLELNDKPGLEHAVRRGAVDFAEPKVTLGRVLAFAIALAGWLWAAIGAGSGAVAKDYVTLRDRVAVIEVQRVEDVRNHERQRIEDQEWRARIEEKLDRIVELSVRRVK